MPRHFPECDRIDWHSVNAIELSRFCRARGRYELARELLELGKEWYEKFARPERKSDASDRQRYRDVLASFKEDLTEFPLLIDTRDRLISVLGDHPQGIDRDKLKKEVIHKGVSSFGVICIQLAQGGWLRQEKSGKKYTLYLERTPPANDEVFVKNEIPTPEMIKSKAATALPLNALNIQAPPGSGSGCLLRFVGLFMVALTLGCGFLIADVWAFPQ